MSSTKRIVILGGGYGGVHAAKKLYKRFKKRNDIEITLIDKNPYHTLMTELHEIAGSRTEPETVQVSFHKIFGGKRVKVVIDEITGVDFDKKVLKSDNAHYSYDYLVIGAGGAPEFFDIPGVQEHSFTLWSLEDALRIRTHVENRFREAAKEPNPERRRRMLTFTIAGAGFTGIELAGELLERRDVLCPKYHIDSREVRVLIIEAKDSILPIFPEKPSKKAEQRIRRMGAELMLNAMITGADEGVVRIGDQEIRTDTFIWTAGIHGGEFSSRVDLTKGHTARGECSVASIEGIHGMAGCAFDEDERYVVGQRGRLLVNDYMQSVDRKSVYVVGDIQWYVEEEHVLPQVVETALQTGETAAKNIIAEIEGKEKEEFSSNYHGFMVSVGSRYGVAHVVGISMSGFFALGIKHLINLHYLFGLAGVNAVWEYIREEFLTIKDHRSMFGGHFAWKVPVYWTVPLRLFLGGKWLSEGIKHLRDGWLNPGSGGLGDISADAIRLPGVTLEDATSGATDAAAAATEAGGEAAGQAAAEYGEPLIEALDIYTWFAENVLSAAPTLAFLLQGSVVVLQVLIGLALIGGLLTFPAAVVSIAFGLMFIASGWGNPELLWYIAASIVMLGGAGRGFGLDHWVMPWLKRWWNGRTIAKRTYLYTGEPRDR
ncbi:MAG: FAD-dependent oxidoreductase [Alkalispirochaeta sp.]